MSKLFAILSSAKSNILRYIHNSHHKHSLSQSHASASISCGKPVLEETPQVNTSTTLLEAGLPRVTTPLVAEQSLEHLKEEDVMTSLSLARNKKTAQSVRKRFAEVRVRHCEESLQALQQELQEFQQEVISIDNELRETESNIGQLRNMVMRSRQVKGVTDGIALYTPHGFYGSANDSSVESICSKAPDDQY